MDIHNKHIAVIGVSQDPEKYGHRIFKDMVQVGWKVDGVNHKGGSVAGRQLYTSLQTIPERPDVVITVVPPKVTEQIVEQAHKLGITSIWMQPGSESKSAIEKAKEYGIEVIHDTCIIKQHLRQS